MTEITHFQEEAPSEEDITSYLMAYDENSQLPFILKYIHGMKYNTLLRDLWKACSVPTVTFKIGEYIMNNAGGMTPGYTSPLVNAFYRAYVDHRVSLLIEKYSGVFDDQTLRQAVDKYQYEAFLTSDMEVRMPMIRGTDKYLMVNNTFYGQDCPVARFDTPFEVEIYNARYIRNIELMKSLAAIKHTFYTPEPLDKCLDELVAASKVSDRVLMIRLQEHIDCIEDEMIWDLFILVADRLLQSEPNAIILISNLCGMMEIVEPDSHRDICEFLKTGHEGFHGPTMKTLAKMLNSIP